jgi:hypothetical protein
MMLLESFGGGGKFTMFQPHLSGHKSANTKLLLHQICPEGHFFISTKVLLLFYNAFHPCPEETEGKSTNAIFYSQCLPSLPVGQYTAQNSRTPLSHSS